MLADAAAGVPEGRWLAADRQSGGRGRLGRDWHSPAGNLYASTIVRLRNGDPEASSLTLVAAVALHEAADAFARGAGDIRIKWPNDLMAGRAKLAGILLERSGDAVVIGFGVNLAHRPEGLDRPTASFPALGLAEPDRDAFLSVLAETFGRWLVRWRLEGLPAVRAAWLDRAHRVGSALTAAGTEGLFDGLEPDGALRLRTPDGTVTIIHAGDVFLL